MNATATASRQADESDDPGSAPEPIPAEPDPRPCAGPGPLIETTTRCAGAADVDVAWIESALRRALTLLDHAVARLGIAIVDDEQMRALHRRHCGQEETTDVLSFSLAEPGAAIEADLCVCLDEAKRQATQRGHAVERELLLYCLHGLLHCAGHDDRTEEGYRKMHAREDEILRHIGVGAVFHTDRGPHRS